MKQRRAASRIAARAAALSFSRLLVMLSSSEPAHIECIRCRPRRHAVRCSSASGSSARPQFHGNVADGSPDLDLLLVAAHHPVAGLAVEGLGESRHVRRCANGTEAIRSMRIGRDDDLLQFWRVTAAPCGRPTNEEALIARQIVGFRSEEHTSELQSLMRISYAVFCFEKQHE